MKIFPIFETTWISHWSAAVFPRSAGTSPTFRFAVAWPPLSFQFVWRRAWWSRSWNADGIMGEFGWAKPRWPSGHRKTTSSKKGKWSTFIGIYVPFLHSISYLLDYQKNIEKSPSGRRGRSRLKCPIPNPVRTPKISDILVFRQKTWDECGVVIHPTIWNSNILGNVRKM